MRKHVLEDLLIAMLVLIAILYLLFLLQGCAAITHRNVGFSYSKTCTITLAGTEATKSVNIARGIVMDDCNMDLHSDARVEEEKAKSGDE